MAPRKKKDEETPEVEPDLPVTPSDHPAPDVPVDPGVDQDATQPFKVETRGDYLGITSETSEATE